MKTKEEGKGKNEYKSIDEMAPSSISSQTHIIIKKISNTPKNQKESNNQGEWKIV